MVLLDSAHQACSVNLMVWFCVRITHHPSHSPISNLDWINQTVQEKVTPKSLGVWSLGLCQMSSKSFDFFTSKMKSWLMGKDSDAGRDWGQEEKDDRGWDGWMASLTRWTWVWMNSGKWWWTGRPGCAAIHGVTKSRTWLSDWTELNWTESLCCSPETITLLIDYTPI